MVGNMCLIQVAVVEGVVGVVVVVANDPGCCVDWLYVTLQLPGWIC